MRLVDVERGDLVPVQQVVKLPSPRLPLLAAGVLAVVAGTVAVFGVGAVEKGDVAPANTIRVAGVDIAGGERVEIDLSRPVPITVSGGDVDAVKLSWNVLGAKLGGAATSVHPGAETAVPVPVNQYVLAGDLTGEVTVSRGGIDTAAYGFGVHTTQRPYLTAAAIAILLLALFSGAYAESNSRALRRGNAPFAATVGLTVSTALFAVAGAGAAWVLLGTALTPVGLIACAALGAAAGFVAAIAGRRMGRRYRYLRLRRIRDLL
ncbi:hypothetical protein [Nocardia sp. NPDC050406]|uniref:hypothetical protein n=1 Tax=Nocardia sp. NPDC050406 TaxID=3364318 RepID=UPI0037BD2BCD